MVLNMSKFIRIIGNCSFNGFGFDIYKNNNGTATIRPTKFGNHMPTKTWVTYDSLDNLENSVNQICGEATGVDRVRILIGKFL